MAEPAPMPGPGAPRRASRSSAGRARLVADFVAGMTDRYAIRSTGACLTLRRTCDSPGATSSPIQPSGSPPMNVYALEAAFPRARALQAEGALPAEGSTSARRGGAAARSAHGDLATNAAMVLAKPASMKPRDIAESCTRSWRADADIAAVEVAGPGFINLTLGRASGTASCARILEEGADYGRADPRPRRDGQRRVRLGQPDRARCTSAIAAARCSAMRWPICWLRRLRGHPRILRQRCRRPGRRARPLGLPALPRGAGRGHRRDPGGPLSRRLSEAGRRGAGRGARHALLECRRSGGCRSCATRRSRRCWR